LVCCLGLGSHIHDQITRQDDDDREDSERAEPAQGHGDAIVHRRNA